MAKIIMAAKYQLWHEQRQYQVNGGVVPAYTAGKLRQDVTAAAAAMQAAILPSYGAWRRRSSMSGESVSSK